MSGDWGWFDGAQKATSLGGVAGTSAGTVVTAPGSTNTKGSWLQITASAAHDVVGLLLSSYWTAGTGTVHALLDIGIGGAGSEVVLIGNIPHTRFSSAGMPSSPILLPCSIPAGTRIAVRYQASATSGAALDLQMMLLAPGNNYPILSSRAATYGANTAASAGTSVDPGGTAHTKGSYVELSAAIEARSSWALISVTQAGPLSGGPQRWLMDLAIGAASSEQIVLPDLMWTGHQDTQVGLAIQRAFVPLALPAGVRLSARCQSSSNSATERPLLVTVHTF